MKFSKCHFVVVVVVVVDDVVVIVFCCCFCFCCFLYLENFVLTGLTNFGLCSRQKFG